MTRWERLAAISRLMATAGWKGELARDVCVSSRFNLPPRPGPVKVQRALDRLRGLTRMLDELLALDAEHDADRAALAPFAAFCLLPQHERAADSLAVYATETRPVPGGPVVATELTVGMFRAARARMPEERERALRGGRS